MKLAPPQNKLQPLPANVQPAVSQSVQRAASPADLQTIQNVQIQEQNSVQTQQVEPVQVPAYATSSGGPVGLWVVLVVAVVIAGFAIWFWRSF